jgi:hypothetical protein
MDTIDCPPVASPVITGLRELDSRRLHRLSGRGPILIGRGRECHVRLRHATVSERHAALSRPGPGHTWTLDPLPSKNPVRVNGVPIIDAVDLQPGWRVDFGAVTLRAYADTLMAVEASSPSSLMTALYALYGSYRRAARWLRVAHSTVRRLVIRRNARRL